MQQVLQENADMVERFLSGNDKVVNAIFGKAMAQLKGKGDPQIVRQVLQAKLDTLK